MAVCNSTSAWWTISSWIFSSGTPAFLSHCTEDPAVVYRPGCFLAVIEARGGHRPQPFTSIAAHIAVASVGITTGEFATAIAGLERAQSLCERGDFPVQRLAVLARLGYAYVFTGRLAEGLGLLEEAAAHVDRVDGFWRTLFLCWLAEGYLVAGRVDDAARAAERAQGLAPDNMPGTRAWTTWLAGEIASHGARTERAAEHYRDAAAADRLELRVLRARCHLSLGRFQRAAGDPRARAELRAMDAFRAMGSRYWLSTAESEVG